MLKETPKEKKIIDKIFLHLSDNKLPDRTDNNKFKNFFLKLSSLDNTSLRLFYVEALNRNKAVIMNRESF